MFVGEETKHLLSWGKVLACIVTAAIAVNMLV
jgi:hypothetical protein